MKVISIDIGGTKIKSGLVELIGDYWEVTKPLEIDSFEELLPKDRALDDDEKLQRAREVTQKIGKIVNQYHSQLKGNSYKIGISVPGIISPEGKILTGVVFGEFPLKEEVENELIKKYGIRVRIHVENDGNCGAYAHGEGQTLMIGTNLGSALNIDRKLIGRNTGLKPSWRGYCIFDEAGYAIRLNEETAWDFFKRYIDRKKFSSYFEKLSEENKDSPNLVRIEQLLGGLAIQKMFDFLYGKNELELGAQELHEIVDGTRPADSKMKSLPEKIWEIEGALLGYAIATLQNKSAEEGYRVKDFHIGGGVAKALHHIRPSAEKYVENYGARNFQIKKSPYDNPNIIGAAIA